MNSSSKTSKNQLLEVGPNYNSKHESKTSLEKFLFYLFAIFKSLFFTLSWEEKSGGVNEENGIKIWNFDYVVFKLIYF